MMKNIRLLLCLFLWVGPLFVSCEMKRDLFGENGPAVSDEEIHQAGLIDLSIEPEKESVLPIVNVSDKNELNPDSFAVTITDSIGQTVKEYGSFASLKKEELLLPMGSYGIQAYWGENIKAGFDAPYYVGDTTCWVQAKEVTKAVVKCRLGNKKIHFVVTDHFKETFYSDYTIVVDNGLGVLTIPSDELRNAYLRNTGTLRFTLYATSKENQICSYSVDMSKDTTVQKHNNVHIRLDANLSRPEEPGPDVEPELPEDPDNPTPEKPEIPDHTLKAPVLKVDITLIEKDYIIEIPSDFVDSEKPDAGGGDPNQEGQKPGDGETGVAKPTIKGDGFDLSSPVQLTPSNAEGKKVRIKIETPGKLASLQVTISSSTGVLEPLLKGLGLGTSFDMCNLTAKQREVLTSLGLAIPNKGITSTVFDISSFMPMIAILDAGNYTFVIKAADEAKQSASKTLTVKLSK